MIEVISLALPPSLGHGAEESSGREESDSSDLGSLFSPSVGQHDAGAFARLMQPYLADPMRGVKRRVRLSPRQTMLTLQREAVGDALRSAGIGLSEVSGIIVSSFCPDDVLIGDGARLARSMAYEGPVWNLDVTTAGSVSGLDFADALVRSGRYEKILVVTSCSYRRFFAPTDGATLFMSDGAGCFLVSRGLRPKWILGSHTENTASFEILAVDVTEEVDGSRRILAKIPPNAFELVNTASESMLRNCCFGACRAAGFDIDEIDFFIFPNPTAWYCDFACEVLGIDASKTISVFERYANLGPVLCVAHLYHAVQEGRIGRGDRVLIFGFGPLSVASAIVVRWGETAVAPMTLAPDA